MQRIQITTVMVLFCFCALAQNVENITVGKKEIIFSKILNEDRRLWIYTPATTSLDKNSVKKYPVMYLLDGEAHFYSTVGIVQQLSQANGNGVLPEMIIVGIENTNRFRDLVPYSSTTANYKSNPFVTFLSSELIPYIDKNYNTAPYKLLAGHSLGGLTAIDILVNSPRSFNAYIAIDPSMSYDNEKIMNNAIAKLPKQNMNGIRLFIGIANTMPNGMKLPELKSNNKAETQHIRSIFKFDNFLKGRSNGLSYAQKYYETERHNTVPLLSEYDGLRFIFDYYFLDIPDKDFDDPTASIALKLKTHYDGVSKEMGYRQSAPEGFINYLGYDALTKKQFSKAEALFKLNIESYPESSTAYNAYADYFVARKDTFNAIENYKKSLQVKNDPATLRKLNAITNREAFSLSADDLQKYAGIYILETFKIDIALKMRDGKLWAIVQGQEDGELVPLSENVFTVKGKHGYTITFEMDGDKPLRFTSVQPNGTFIVVFKSR